MLDKDNNQKLIDQGWKKMSGLLNRDMPVAKNRRRLLWILWIPALFLIVTAIGLGIYAQMDKGDQSPPVEEQYVPMANAENNNPSESIEKEAFYKNTYESKELPESNNANELINNDLSEISYVENSNKNRFTPQEISGKNKHNLKSKPIDSRPIKQESLSAQLLTNIDGVQNDKQEQNELDSKVTAHTNAELPRKIETESIVLPIQSDLAAETKAVAFLNGPVQFLSRVEEQFPVLPAFAFEPIIKPVQISSSLVGVSLGVRASFNRSLGLEGIGIGPEARFPLSKKLKGYVGLLYENQKKDGFFNLNSREDALAQGTVTTPVAFFNDLQGDPLAALSAQASYQDIQSLSNSFHYLHLPIGLEYLFGTSFALHGGVRFSRMLSAPSKYQIAVVQGDLVNQDLERLDGFSNNALFSNDLVRKNDISATIGASLYLGRRWALAAEYNHGILPIIGIDDTDGSNAYNRIFSVGLSYHFSRS